MRGSELRSMLREIRIEFRSCVAVFCLSRHAWLKFCATSSAQETALFQAIIDSSVVA
jgi:hypothetical protein